MTLFHVVNVSTGIRRLKVERTVRIENLNVTQLYPSKLRRPIMNLYEGKPAPVYLGNECAGDPEVTD